MMMRILIAFGLVSVGAAGMYVAMRPAESPEVAAPAAEAPAAAGVPSAESRALTLALTPDAVRRAGIEVVPVTASTAGIARRLPGVVEPNGYRTVDVTPVVGGSVVSMAADLGAVVTRGAIVARLRSPELTDEVRRWLTFRAERDVVARRLTRTQGLVKIGAASRQELEEVEADVVRADTELGTARARLARLGFTDAALQGISLGDAIPETIDVRAPADGVVIRRTANPGQNVGPDESLLALADLGTVWVMGDLFEQDLAHVRLGQAATVTSDALPERTWTGRVTYIDPEVARETRTVRVRVEVPNPGGALKFGMFVGVSVSAGASASRVVVPRTAVQSLGAVSVVYVEDGSRAGRFTERVVVLGDSVDDAVDVRSGIVAGDRVVAQGSFFLRAERDRLGWPAPQPPAPPMPPVTTATATAAPSPVAVVTRVIEVTAAGLVPARVTVPPHQPIELVFIRRVEETCGTELLIPAVNVRRALPLNERVIIRLEPRAPGDLTFSCGMDMLKGVIIVR
jgi:RND family efflux transporter MFP subunit